MTSDAGAGPAQSDSDSDSDSTRDSAAGGVQDVDIACID